MASRKVKQVIVMRNDLNMRKGKMIAQGSHASMGFLTKGASIVSRDYERGSTIRVFEQDCLRNPEEIDEWLTEGFTKVCLQCSSETELILLHTQALAAGLNVHLITDSGFTEFAGVPTRTCLAIGPNKNEEIDKITGHLKLL